MDIKIYILLIFIISIQSNCDFSSIDDEHCYESPVDKYSEQVNLKEFFNMNHDLTLSNNNIFLLILLINLIPVIIIFFLIPITILRRYEILLISFLSFTSGGLMADVFLRLIPSMINSYKNSIELHNNHIGLVILLGIFLSFFIEKFFRYFQNNEEEQQQMNTTFAYLFLLANVLYNYTNNLNLSSIFQTKSTMNINMVIIQVIYQVLYVFYGYAILIYSGMSTTKAMRFLLLTKFISSIFCIICLQFQLNSIAPLLLLLLPIIAGIFVYISTVHMIPNVMEHNSGIKGTIFKIGVSIISVLIIFSLNKYE